MSDEALRVRSIRVSGLFGLYDHEVILDKDRVTVIHGPNGVGKTVFLKLIFAFLKGRYIEMINAKFNEFEIQFSDQTSVRFENYKNKHNKKYFKIYYKYPGKNGNVISTSNEFDVHRFARELANQSPYLLQTADNKWIDRRTDEVFLDEEILSRSDAFAYLSSSAMKVAEPDALKKIREVIGVHLIETQRLIKFPKEMAEYRFRESRNERLVATVLEYSDDLKSRIEASLVEYAKQSQKLDQSFPRRLLNGFSNILNAEELAGKMRSVEFKREKFKRLGILDENDTDVSSLWNPSLESLDRSQLSVMSVYVHDMSEKMAILEVLSNRIELFLEVLNRKFTNKTLSINRERGLVVKSVDKEIIHVSALSSGEQHELVLIYDLLFKVSPNALVMIDEPELSLHISWQKEFIRDITEIIGISHFDVLMATHSPYIVGERFDLLVELSSVINSNKK